MKLRESFRYNEFEGNGILKGSIFLDGEVTSVAGNDQDPVLCCTFGTKGNKYHKVITVKGVLGLKLVKRWNGCWLDNAAKKHTSVPPHTTRPRYAGKHSETSAPVPASAPAPTSAPVASHTCKFPSGEGIISSFAVFILPALYKATSLVKTTIVYSHYAYGCEETFVCPPHLPVSLSSIHPRFPPLHPYYRTRTAKIAP